MTTRAAALRILLATDLYPPFIGGSELVTRALGEELAKRGHAVTVATVWHKGLAERETSGGVAVRRLRGLTLRLPWAYSDPSRRRYHPPFPDPLITRGLHQLIRECQPDVVDASGWIAYSARLASSLSDVPFVLTARDFGHVCPIRTFLKDGEVCSGPAFEKCLRHASDRYGLAKATAAVVGVLGLRRWLIRGTAALHVLSPYMVDLERRNLTGDETLIEVIPDPASSYAWPSLSLGAPPSGADATGYLERLPREPFILFVGALLSHKGIEPLLAAYGRLRPAPPLVMIGTLWPDSPGEWPSDVTVLTDVPHAVVQQIWDRALFGVAPSIVPEAFPGVVVEAMQHGKPIIASAIGGPLDSVLHGQTGLLVPPGDVAALAEAMEMLVADADLRERMGTAAEACFRRNLAAETLIPRYERFYAEVASSWSHR